MIYVAVFNLMVLLRLVLANSARLRAQLYVPLLIALFLFSAFRFETGCDWTGYLNQYWIYSRFTLAEALEQPREVLWTTLFVIQNWLDIPYPWINVFSSVIFFAGLHAMARRQPEPLVFLLLLFPILIINMPMSAIRQSAAIGVMFFAFNAFVDRRIILFGVYTIIAGSMHSSALIFLVLLPLVGGNYSLRRLILSGILALLGTLLLWQGEAAEVAMVRYIQTDRDAAGAVFRVGLVAVTGLYFSMFLRRKWKQEFPNDFKLAMIGSFFMIAMLAILPISSIIADRLAYYLLPVQAMIFARIPFLPIGNGRHLHIAFPYVLVGTAFLVWTSISRLFNLCYLPYQTWIFGFPDQIQWNF